MVPHLINFIEQSKHVTESIIVLSGAITIARAVFVPSHLLPLLPTILQQGMNNPGDFYLIPSILDILMAIADTRAIDFGALMSDKVIAFVQSIISEEEFSEQADPLLRIFYKQHDPSIQEHIHVQKLPVLVHFLFKNGIPTSKYVMALVMGGAVKSMVHEINDLLTWKVEMISAMQRLSFFGAEEIVARPGMVKLLVTYVAKEWPIPAATIVWMLTLRKRSRRKMTEEDKKNVGKFAVDFSALSASKHMQHLKTAILTNLHASGTLLPHSHLLRHLNAIGWIEIISNLRFCVNGLRQKLVSNVS
jgi:hypothetical protein